MRLQAMAYLSQIGKRPIHCQFKKKKKKKPGPTVIGREMCYQLTLCLIVAALAGQCQKYLV